MTKGSQMLKVSIGAAAGFVVMLLLQGREPSAQAAPAQSVDNQGKFTVAVGGSEPNRYDLVWVLHERPYNPKLKPGRGADAKYLKDNQITLALYKAEDQGKKMKFVASREIAYDLELNDWNQERPEAKEVFQLYKDAVDRAAKK
jgi:hypothetical protein